METETIASQGTIVRAQFARLLLMHKADIGMADTNDADLERLAPAILGSLVRLSLMALCDPDEADNARHIAALRWSIEWASISGIG
jgi:hypothetical protein